MSSPFEQAAHASSAAVNDVYGESVRIEPMKPGRYAGPVPDTDRTPRIVTAAPAISARRIRMSDDKFGRDFNTQFSGARISFSVADSELSGLVVRNGDRVVRIDHGGEKFEIVNVAPIGMVRTLFDLVRMTE